MEPHYFSHIQCLLSSLPKAPESAPLAYYNLHLCCCWRHNIQYDDTQHNIYSITECYFSQLCCLSLNVECCQTITYFAACRYAECLYTSCHYAKCHGARWDTPARCRNIGYRSMMGKTYNISPLSNVTKLFCPKFTYFHNRLKFLSSLVQCLWGRLGAYPRVEHLKGASFVWALALPANIRLA
jgi:hypothetical protein